MSKSGIYRFLAPFRSRTQARLRNERLGESVETFASQIKDSDRHPEIAPALWELLKEHAFIEDFRPGPDDDLYKIFAMDPEIVRDELIDSLLTKLGLSVDGIDFAGFDFASITTPRDVSSFATQVADAQGKADKQRMSDLAR